MSAENVQEEYSRFLGQLVEAGLLIPSGVKGVFGRSGVFEGVVDKFEAAAARDVAAHGLKSEEIFFPPVFNRDHYTCTDHIHSFPNLMGSVHSFTGNDAAQAEMIAKLADGKDWTRDLTPTGVMLAPATCYPLYPSATGTLTKDGRTVTLKSFVFRHEPSDDPARMQIFRMREYVRIGTPEQAVAHRDFWLAAGERILKSVGLPVKVVVANDPFFGRGGRLRKATQREQNLKFEIVAPICSREEPTAIASCNYHLDSFGLKFKIQTPDGATAHSACFGFGLERITLALFKTHGLDPARWPQAVRETLGL